MQPVDIQIFGRSIKVNCPLDQQDMLNIVVKNLNTRLYELKTRSKVTNIEQLILVLALNLCYELEQEKEKINKYTSDVESRILALQQSIEQVLDVNSDN